MSRAQAVLANARILRLFEGFMEARNPAFFSKVAGFFQNRKMEVCLFALSFLLLWGYMEPFMMEWDGYGYLRNIAEQRRSGLGLGRVGFIFPFAFIWGISRQFGVGAFDFHYIVSFFNILFSSTTVVVWYILAGRLFKDRGLALGSALIMMFTKGFIRTGSEILTEPLAMLLAYSSILVYSKALDEENAGLMAVSGLLFGYSLEVRESNMYMMLPFLVIYLEKEGPRGQAMKSLGLFTIALILAASIGPIAIYMNEGSRYTGTIKNWLTFNKSNIPHIWETLDTSIKRLEAGFGPLLPPVLGLIYLMARGKHAERLILYSLLAPLLAFSLFGCLPLRYFVTSFPSLALLTAVFLSAIADLSAALMKLERRAKTLFFALVAIWIALNFVQSHAVLAEDIKASEKTEAYGLFLLNNFTEDTVFLVGGKTPMMKSYLVPLSGSKKIVIPNWTGEKLPAVVEAYRAEGKTIVVQPGGYSGAEKEEVDALMRMHAFKNIGMGLYELKPGG